MKSNAGIMLRSKKPVFLSFIVALFLFAAVYPTQIATNEKETVLMRTLITFLDQYHFDPKSIDDEFSAEFYDEYLRRRDYDKRLFTQEDLDHLQFYRNQLDDEIRDGTYQFFDLTQEKYRTALDKTQSYYQEILSRPFDFDRDEEFQLDAEKRPFASNDKELKDRWRKILKYRTLVRLNNKLEAHEKREEGEEKKSFAELEAESRKEELERFEDLYSKLKKVRREHELSAYLSTLTNLYDPHSSYFEPKQKQDFDINMSGQLEGIGATLTNDGEYVKVERIVAGGPAWKQKELEVGDYILKVKEEKTGEEIEMVGMLVTDAVQYIRGKKGTEVTLTVQKMDGTKEEITILRDVVIIEENFAKSLILDSPFGERIGFISLPSFYSDFQNPNGRSCTEDVAKEIEKLKEENVDGIILDIRYNGGGSLYEVVKMTGLFIEEGPIVQVKDRIHNADVLSDKDPRVQYHGPLAVMVNTYSASASEILAAALQDYGRAVIVGGQSTFGKGTVQQMADLDRIRGFSDFKPLGAAKITIQKFYRINGGSVQLKGVIPDVVLPDNFHFIEAGEKEEENAIPWTKIDPVEFDQKVYAMDKLDRVKELSQKRIQENVTFQKILQNAQRMKDLRSKSVVPLSWEKYFNMEQKEKEESREFTDLFDQVVNEGIHNLEVDRDWINLDESRKARNEDWHKRVSKDLYITETMRILHDLEEANG